ncbi:MAG: dockerin type I domain-containing protein [Planctomycetota bacterium]
MSRKLFLPLALVLACTVQVSAQSDECAGAVPAVTGNNPLDTTVLTLATSAEAYSAVPCPTIGTMDRDGWWIWNSGPGGVTAVDLCVGSPGFDSDLVVYDATGGCGALVQVACAGDECPGFVSQLTFVSAPATNYYIRIGSWGAGDPGFVGSFDITVTPPSVGGILHLYYPPGINSSGAALDCLGLTGVTTSVTTQAAFVTQLAAGTWDAIVVDEPAFGIAAGSAMETAITGYVAGGGAAVLAFWDLDASPALRAAFGVATAVSFTVPQAIVCGASCADAVWTDPNALASVAAGGNGFFDDGDQMTAAVGGTVIGEFGGGSAAIIRANSGRTIVLGEVPDALNPQAGRDLLANAIESILSAPGGAPATGAGPCAPIVGPMGDECATAFVAVDGSNAFDTTGMTSAASADPYNDAQCVGTFLGTMSRDAWWTYEATTTGNALVSLCAGAAGFDSDLVIYEGTCAGLTQIACSGDFGGPCGLTSQTSFSATAGSDYVIRIGSWGTGAAGFAGTFDISYGCTSPPANDNCAAATIIAVDVVDLPFDTGCATNDGPVPTCGGITAPLDIWFRYDAGATGILFVDTLGSLFNTRIAAYASCGALAPVACNTGGLAISFPVTSGMSYFLQVSGFDFEVGTGDLTTNLVIPIDLTGIDVALVNGEGTAGGGLVVSQAAYVAALTAASLSYVEIEPAIDVVSGCPTVGWIYNNGTFPDDDAVPAQIATLIRDCVLGGNGAYIQGGDLWGFLPDTDLSAIDGVNSGVGGAVDGGDLVTSVSGIAGSTLDGFASAYTQDQGGNDWTDDLVAAGPGLDLLGDNAELVIESPVAGVDYDVAILYLHDDGVAPGAGDVYSTSIEPAGLADAAAHLDEIFDLIGFTGGGPTGPNFRRGDVNRDGSMNIADAVSLLSSLFVPGSPAPSCAKSADANDDGSNNIADAITILSALFVPGSPPPPAPGPITCGTDPTADALTCVTTAPCP